MAKGKKTGGRNFKPGQSGNPAGRVKLPDDLRQMREFSKTEVERSLHTLMFKTLPEIKKIAAKGNRSSTMVDMIAAKILERAYTSADHWRFGFILDRAVGPVPRPGALELLPPGRDVTPAPKKTFTEFCTTAGYPVPYPKQIEMVDFGFSSEDPRLLLGARGTGKTDYVTIMGVAYKIYLDPGYRVLIQTKEEKRCKAIISEIAKALTANGVVLEKDTALVLRVQGLEGKDHSVEGLSIRSGMRGRHPDMILMDDPVTDEDVSEATRKLVERKYNEAMKLTDNILIIGQPAHAYDLYAKLRKLVKKMEVPWGSIPELDHDLEAQRLAGVDEKSIQASYFLKIVTDGQMPFENIKYIDAFPRGGAAVAFIDPSHTGKDTTALSVFKQHFDGLAVEGYVWKKAWNHCLDDMMPIFKALGVKRVGFETNGVGDQPVIMLQELSAKLGLGFGVVGRPSLGNKHARIMAAGGYAHQIHLSKRSSAAYTDQVVKYEYGATPDDAPDSLATGMAWIGLIKETK